MHLALVVSLLLADSYLSPERPVTVSKKRAVAVLSSPRSSWEQRYGALEALRKHVFTPAEVSALQKALPTLSHAAAGTCEDTRDPPCDVTLGPCLSPAGFALAAVEGSNVNDAFVDAALELTKPLVDPWSASIARRVLAKAKHPSTEALALPLLDGRYSCVEEGAHLLFSVETLSDDGRRVLEQKVRGATNNQRALGALVANRKEPWSRALKQEALSSPDTGLRLGSVRFAWVKGADPELLQTMAQVAACDPSSRLRNELRERFTASKVDLPDAGCPLPPEALRVEGTTVRGRDGGVVAQLGTETALAPAPEACVAASKRGEATSPLGQWGTHCVLGLNLGEWGGALYDFPSADGGVELIVFNAFLHPRAVVKRGDELLVLSAANRYGFGSGGIGRLELVDGGLHYEPLTSWSGTPVAWATTRDTLFVSFAPGDFISPCLSKGVGEVTYRYANDGGWSLVRGEATTCLWPD